MSGHTQHEVTIPSMQMRLDTQQRQLEALQQAIFRLNDRLGKIVHRLEIMEDRQ